MSNDSKDKAARARNKTVMLTPDIANQMRSRLMTGVHRSGSTEKLDTGLINQVRENFGSSPQSFGTNPVHPRERDTEDKQTQIIDANKFMNRLPEIEEEPPLEMNFLDALKARETKREAPEIAKTNPFDKLNFDIDEELQSNPVNLPQEEPEFIALTDLDENLEEESALDLQELEAETYQVDTDRIDITEDNFKEEIIMEQPVGNLNMDLKRGVATATKQATGSGANQCLNGDVIKWEKETPLVGFLVSFDGNPKGDYIVLRTGRLIVSSDSADKGNLLIIKDETVSPMHAILRISESNIVVLDQLSENGTKILKADGGEVELSGDKANLEHGDTIIFGDRNYKVCLLF